MFFFFAIGMNFFFSQKRVCSQRKKNIIFFIETGLSFFFYVPLTAK